jgi:hypothetical protein
VLWLVSITTSAPQALHLNVSTSSVEGRMSAEPEPTISPTSLPMSPFRSKASTAFSLDHS